MDREAKDLLLKIVKRYREDKTYRELFEKDREKAIKEICGEERFKKSIENLNRFLGLNILSIESDIGVKSYLEGLDENELDVIAGGSIKGAVDNVINQIGGTIDEAKRNRDAQRKESDKNNNLTSNPFPPDPDFDQGWTL